MSLKSELRNVAGSVIMASFGTLALSRWFESGALFFLLFGLRDWLAAYFFWVRREASSKGRSGHTILAYVSSGLPLVCQYSLADASVAMILATEVLTIAGFLLVTLATIELGDRLGISPARRGQRCTKGVYRLFSHPMYFGYAIAEMGAVLVSWQNLPIYFLSVGLYVWRARVENRVLTMPDQSSNGAVEFKELSLGVEP